MSIVAMEVTTKSGEKVILNIKELKTQFTMIFAIRDFIEEQINTMAQVDGCDCTVSDFDNEINYCYHQTVRNGGIAVEWSYGVPSDLYTPLGYLPVRRRISSYLNIPAFHNALKQMRQKICDKFGMTFQ